MGLGQKSVLTSHNLHTTRAFYIPFCLFLLCFFLLSLPSSVGMVPPTPLLHPRPSGLHPYQLQSHRLPAVSWFTRSFHTLQLVWLTNICFLSLSPLCLSSLCLQMFCLWFPPFPQCPVWQGCQSGNLTELNIPAFKILLSISLTGYIWFVSLPPLSFASQVCVSVYSRIWLSSYLIIPFCTENVLDQTSLKE